MSFPLLPCFRFSSQGDAIKSIWEWIWKLNLHDIWNTHPDYCKNGKKQAMLCTQGLTLAPLKSTCRAQSSLSCQSFYVWHKELSDLSLDRTRRPTPSDLLIPLSLRFFSWGALLSNMYCVLCLPDSVATTFNHSKNPPHFASYIYCYLYAIPWVLSTALTESATFSFPSQRLICPVNSTYLSSKIPWNSPKHTYVYIHFPSPFFNAKFLL